MKNITFKTFYDFINEDIGDNIFPKLIQYKANNRKNSAKLLEPNVTCTMHLFIYSGRKQANIIANAPGLCDVSVANFRFDFPKDGYVSIYRVIDGNAVYHDGITLPIDTNIFDLETKWSEHIEHKNLPNATEILVFLIMLLYSYAKEN